MEPTEDVRRINGVEVHFPYKPYPSQISMMAKIIAGVKNRQNCLLESPTGSGKSLALLCSALAWQAGQRELARKEDQERSDIENGICTCNNEKTLSSSRVTGCQTPQAPPVMSPHFSSTPVLGVEPIPHSNHPRSLLNTTKQGSWTAAQTLARRASQAKANHHVDSDDEDFKPSKKSHIPGSAQGVSRLPLQMACETSQNTGKPVTIKFLSKGPNGQMTEQQKVIVLPAHVPGQNMSIQTMPGQVVSNPTVPLKVESNQIVPDQVVPGTEKNTGQINGQASVIMKTQNTSTTSVPGQFESLSESSFCPCDCQAKKGPPPPKRKIPKIYFGTRTHKQIAQIVRELRKTFYRDVKMTILASREHTCIHPAVSKSSTKNDGCRDLLDGPGCLFNNNVRKISSQNALQNFYGQGTAWDIEDLVSLCSEKRIKACPYYVSRGLRGESDIIFCPYNYLVDPIIRKTMEINIKDEIIILDEAHNIEDSAREAVSKSIDHDSLTKIIKELEDLVKREVKEFEHQELLQMCSRLDDFIRRSGSQLEQNSFDQASTVWAGMDIVARLVQVGLGPKEFPALQRVLAAVCEEDEAEKRREGGFPPPRLSMGAASVLDALFTMLDFLYRDDLRFVEDYRVAIVRSISYSRTMDTSGQWLTSRKNRGRREMRQVFTLNFWCLNPAVAFSDFAAVRNIVLTSGTLSPMSSFSSELGMSFPIQLEANHVIKDSQVWVGSIGEGPSGGKLQATYRNTETFGFQDELGKLVLEVCRAIPHGVLCFLPSYKMLEKLSERWQLTGLWGEIIKKKKIISEPRRGDKADFDDLLKYFYNVIEGEAAEDSDYDCDETDGAGTEVDGALFLAVCRGKVSEGLDFADNNARAVITVGIPFPNFKDIQVELKRKYNDRYTNERGLLSGSEWYEIQAYRALNQALGRCIRHRNDWGALIMIDDRFVRQPQKYIKGLSKWVRNKAQTFGTFRHAISSLQNFTQLRLKRSDMETSNVSEVPFSQGQSSCLETPVKRNPSPFHEELNKGDNVNDVPTPAKLVTSTPHPNAHHAQPPTATPIGRVSPPMSPLRQADISTVVNEEKPHLASEIKVYKPLDDETKTGFTHTKNLEETKPSATNKFFKFCNISSENNNNNKDPLGEGKDETCTVKSEVSMNDEEFLKSTPNLFESDMSDPEAEDVTDREKNDETKPVARRPLFRRAPIKGSNSYNEVKQNGGEVVVKGDGDAGHRSRSGRLIKPRKYSSDSEYDVPDICKSEANGHSNIEEEDFDDGLKTKRYSRNRKRKVQKKSQNSNKRPKGVDFLDDWDVSDDKPTDNKDEKKAKGIVSCVKCGAVLVQNAKGMEKRKRLPAFLRSVWKQRSCESLFISQGQITQQLTPVTSSSGCCDGAELNSVWDETSQCCVQYLRCKSCPLRDSDIILGAGIALASESSDFKTGQIWLHATSVT